MSQNQITNDLLGLQGFRVLDEGIEICSPVCIEGREVIPSTVVVSVVPDEGSGYRCSGCGEGVLWAYDHLRRRHVRDFPIWGQRCVIAFTPARVDCPQCGVRIEALECLVLRLVDEH